jgi:two-component system chemotaxis response regulator CheB
MPGHDIIVIGASVGGVQTLLELVQALPPGLPAALFVVCHFPPHTRSNLPEILSRNGPLLASHARDGEPIYPGHIYVAPEDRHLLLERDRVRVMRGPRENRLRPAIDPLFRSAARVFGPRAVGVILSGVFYDGVAGLMAIRAAGGIAVVQDPRDAPAPSLPQTAFHVAGADHLVPASALAPLLVDLVRQPVAAERSPDMTDPMEKIPHVMTADMKAQVAGNRHGKVSVFSCPECGGCMWQVDDNKLLRFNCHVGHSYYAESLLADQAEALNAALWTAVRIFKEQSLLARQLAGQHLQQANGEAAGRFQEQAEQADRYGSLIEQYLLGGEENPIPSVPPDQP